MDNVKFCCLDKNIYNKKTKNKYNSKYNTVSRSKNTKKAGKSNNYGCAPINSKSNKSNNTNIKLNKKLAIFTLIFGGDNYVPGVLLLGSSIRKANTRKANMITLGCMVAKDVSKEARLLLEKVFDVVKEVEYIEINPNLINHSNEATRKVYAKTFTKLRCFEMTEYDKILFMDADTLVLKDDVFELFKLQTPACPFMGGEKTNRYFKTPQLFKKFQSAFCNNMHGNLIPYNSRVNEKTTSGLNIETSVMVLTPDLKLAKRTRDYLENIKKQNIKIKTDTELVSLMFKDKIYAIDPRFFGRWVNPEKHPELVILDLYGNEGKPWDIKRIDGLVSYVDVNYWWKLYCKIYKSMYKKYKSEMLDTLYEKIQEVG